ncbi:MAG: type III-A CRISPR-associated protein Cas10/Csm1 [Candidatus Latescibacterota bacterium]|nr:MAG: type III-A CRISPR-associated protein Cas10/Csm1 [Candidatus Latescibacterota bacterium]
MDTYKVALAGLLHDIGKFWQRTGKPHPKEFTKEDYGEHGAHAAFSAEFVGRYVPEGIREGLGSVLYHHNPKDLGSLLIAVSDWLSSGEREEAPESPEPLHLRSVFDRIMLRDGPPCPEDEWYYPLKPISLDAESIFPRPGEARSTRDEHEELWKDFEGEVKLLDGMGLKEYVETLYHLLMKYTWCVPSAYYRSVPDVSLYDHSRTTAAIAVCLHLQGTSEGKLRELTEALRRRDGEVLSEPLFLLVGGDISGIQDFLYTLTSRGAAKGLRGRSLYLQLLLRAAAELLLKGLGLPSVNLLYIGGGNFYLLAPLSAEDRLCSPRKDIARRLLSLHGGELYLALCWVEVSPGDFLLDGSVPSRWMRKVEELFEELARAKERRFSELGDEVHALFEPQGEGGEPRFCQVCHSERDVREVDGIRKCALCRSLEKLGEEASRAEWLVLEEVEPPSEVKPLGYEDVLSAFGLRVGLVRKLSQFKPSGGNFVRALRLRDADFLGEGVNPGWAYGFDFQARAVPTDDGHIKDFSEIAEEGRGIKRLGVLRMDVDNLGRLFREGLGARASMSRLSTMSRSLSIFFKGYISSICEDFPGAYLTYSGGDDLFLVCPWDRAPELGLRIREEFGRFVCDNPNVTISAGIAMVPGKYPLYRAARLAGEALEEAKDVRRERDGAVVEKDAISFLGQAMGWEVFGEMREVKLNIMELLDIGVPRGLLTRLWEIYELYRRTEMTAVEDLLSGEMAFREYVKAIHYSKWQWRLVYTLIRVGKSEHKDSLRKLQEVLLREGMVRLLGPAVRWAEFETREAR